jgi:membrane dipeptidase
VEAIEHVIGVAGEDNVGIGTDFTQGHGHDFFEMLSRDKGYARRLVDLGAIGSLPGLETLGDLPNLTAAMETAGWPETRLRKILGENWLRVLDEVWSVAPNASS